MQTHYPVWVSKAQGTGGFKRINSGAKLLKTLSLYRKARSFPRFYFTADKLKLAASMSILRSHAEQGFALVVDQRQGNIKSGYLGQSKAPVVKHIDCSLD